MDTGDFPDTGNIANTANTDNIADFLGYREYFEYCNTAVWKCGKYFLILESSYKKMISTSKSPNSPHTKPRE